MVAALERLAQLPTWAVVLALNTLIGVASAASLVLYGLAFSAVPRAPGFFYYAKLLFHPYFILAAGLSFGMALVVRMHIFSSVGVQRGIFSAPLATAIVMVIAATVFHQQLSMRQWMGAAVILVGTFMLTVE